MSAPGADSTRGRPSFKNLRAPKLVTKLHAPTRATSTGIGIRTSAIPNRVLGQGKRQIWIGIEQARIIRENCSDYAYVGDDPWQLNNRGDLSVRPRAEGCRAAALIKLRKSLVALSGATSPPALAFERWLLDSLLTESIKSSNDSLLSSTPTANVTLSSPVLGPLCQAVDLTCSTIVSDLVRASMSQAKAVHIAQTLQGEAQEALCMIQDIYSSASQTLPPTSSCSSSNVIVAKHRHTLDIQLLGSNTRRLLKLNHEHYGKLRSLWDLTHETARQKNRDSSNVSVSNDSCIDNGNDDERFHADLFVLLSRYFSLQGHGFQAACPEAVFQVLHADLGVSHECFASPLNCYFGSFNSAFPDSDIPFGSQGSFWTWHPGKTGGSFQANPPFVANLMARMVDRIELFFCHDEDNVATSSRRATAAATKSASPQLTPLSFTIIVPGWQEDEAFQRLLSSRYLRAFWLIPKEDHGFCDGAQHQRRDRYRESPYDTAVFVLQNDSGFARWAPNATIEAKLRCAFATGRPTEAAMRRRKRDGRGFADQDGGGGKYRGKKRNRTGKGVEQRRQEERLRNRKKKKMEKDAEKKNEKRRRRKTMRNKED